MTIEQFTNIYAVLALQLQASDTDTPSIRAYYRVLKDFEPALLQLAAEQLAATSTWFPKSSEWLKTALVIKQERRTKQQHAIQQLHRQGIELCEQCSDTGWLRDANGRASQCPCQDVRRAEILGVKPLPALTGATT